MNILIEFFKKKVFSSFVELLNSSNIVLLNSLGEKIEFKKKQRRLAIIESSDQPLVSIILPVYNSENTIGKAIKSIIDQSYSSWELLIIDDGSGDGTIEVIKTLSSKDHRIKTFRLSTNKGVAFARNIGLHFAKGEFITFHDADDYSHEERLEYQVFEFLSEPSLSIVVFKCVRVNEHNEVYIINGKAKWNRVSGMMFAKCLVDEIGYFKQTHISEDSEYHERILAVFGRGKRKIINKVLYFALFNPNSLLFSNANVKIEGNRIGYQINETEAKVLSAFREEHKKIRRGELSPYQNFEFNSKDVLIFD